MGVKISIAILENNEVVVLKTKNKSNTVFPAILVLGMYPKDMKSAGKWQTCTLVFIAELLTVVQDMEWTYVLTDGWSD